MEKQVHSQLTDMEIYCMRKTHALAVDIVKNPVRVKKKKSELHQNRI